MTQWRELGDMTQGSFGALLTGTPLWDERSAIQAAVSPHSILYAAHLQQESNYGREGIAAGGTHNPTGLRPRGDGGQQYGTLWTGGNFLKFDSWTDAAKEWKARVTDPSYAYASDDTVPEYVHTYAPSSDGNNEVAYINAIMAMYYTYGGTVTPIEKPPANPYATYDPAGWKTYDVVGANEPIASPVPIIIRLVSASQSLQRPGYALATPLYYIQHETDDSHATAADENAYVLNGAEGRQASWHFEVDDHFIYQNIPTNEVTWQAADGSGPGNMNSISCELCVYTGIDKAKARFNAQCLAVGMMKAQGIPAANLTRHWDRNWMLADPPCSAPCDREGDERHHCPQQMMDEGYWARTYVPFVNAALAKPTTIKSSYRNAVLPGWWSEETIDDGKDRTVNHIVWKSTGAGGVDYVVTANTGRYAWSDSHAKKTGPGLVKGQTVRIYYIHIGYDGKEYGVSRGGSRIWTRKLTPAKSAHHS